VCGARTLAGLALVILAVSPLSAQHAETDPTVQNLDEQGCVLCHGGHPGGGGYGLKIGQVPGAEAQAPGLGNVSKSCLRCHASASLRERQPEFRGRFDSDRGRFLGVDLADDHPLGRFDSGTTGSLNAWRSPEQTASFKVSGFGFAGGPDAVECVLCHDPHDRTGALPGPFEQQEICGSCHETLLVTDINHVQLACTDCHKLHGGRRGDLLAASPTVDMTCNTCHAPAGGASVVLERRDDLLDPTSRGVGAAPSHTPPRDGDCVDCHTQHQLN
jgi:hypothetical protein